MKTVRTTKSVEELIKTREFADLLEYIVNRMGINLVSVRDLSWVQQEDGQFVELTINFIPYNGG